VGVANVVVDTALRTVVVFAGGTGGHVYPALAVAVELESRGYSIHWFGTDRGLESRVIPAAGFPLHRLRVQGIRGKGAWGRVRGVLAVFGALLQSLRELRRLRPVCALGMGGYVAGPGGIAAWMLRVPLVIHEQNSVAGTTNRLLRRFARRVLTAYPGAFGAGRMAPRQVGNPVRADLLAQGSVAAYSYRGERPLHLLVLGGSLGARAINEVVPAMLAVLPASLQLRIKHQAGPAHGESVLADYATRGLSQVEVLPYIEDMAAAYHWADLVLCRAGALTVAELTIMGRPAVFVPLPQAIDNHQAHNAAWLAERGAAIVLPQAELSAAALADTISELVAQPERLRAMAQAARSAAAPGATVAVADVCEEIARER